MILIDGNFGEGGGQIVRTALALSTITGKPFRVTNIRQGRKQPGLKTQHVHCVKALENLCGSKSVGAHLGSEEISYYPGKIKAKNMVVDFGTAGSITLFLQAFLPVMFFTEKKMTVKIVGGTDVNWSPQIDYLKEVIVPQLRRFCEDISVKTMKRGYYPKGGGMVEVKVTAKDLIDMPKINILDQYKLIKIKGVSHSSKTLEGVAERQAVSAELKLKSLGVPVDIRVEYADTLSKGSGVTLWAIFSKDENDIDFLNPIRLGADVLGAPGKPSEDVGNEAADMLIEKIKSNTPVDEHLADNLIPWMGLSKNCSIKVSRVSNHIKTNIYVTEKFLGEIFSIQDNIVKTFDRKF